MGKVATVDAVWYLVAPPVGMLTAVILHCRVLGIELSFTQPKLNPSYTTRCIHSGYEPRATREGQPADA